MKVEFFKHNLGKEEINSIKNVLGSVFLTTGPITKKFEEEFAKYIGCKYIIGVTSCTAALFLSLKAHGIGEGDEVITTPMTFIATANVIIHAGAKPILVEVEPKTGNIDSNLIEKLITKKTKAIIPVHLYGQMCDMKKINKIAKKHKLVVIEDAAHAVESKRNGIRVGQLSECVCFSFYATKNVTCGEGGAIGTNNKLIADKLRKMRLFGMNKGASDRYVNKYQHWDMELLGWKYNMDDIKASLLLPQIKKIDSCWKRREQICQMYEKAFTNVQDIQLLKILDHSKSGRHLFTILVSPQKRDKILWEIQKKDIGVAVNYRAIHLLKYYRTTLNYKKGSFPVAEKIGSSTITLPLYPKMTNKEVNYVIDSVKNVIKKI